VNLTKDQMDFLHSACVRSLSRQYGAHARVGRELNIGALSDLLRGNCPDWLQPFLNHGGAYNVKMYGLLDGMPFLRQLHCEPNTGYLRWEVK
jgi:hypothetical protein